jgi:hypothetical protein
MGLCQQPSKQQSTTAFPKNQEAAGESSPDLDLTLRAPTAIFESACVQLFALSPGKPQPKPETMRKLSALFLLLSPVVLFAQNRNLFVNVQLHRDFHREIFTSTIEVLELDRLGTTFLFSDFDYDSAGETGSYFEVARNLAVWKPKRFTANLSVQYNDGVLSFDALGDKNIPRTILGGIALSHILIGPAYFELQGLARQEFGAKLGFQFTGVWSVAIPKTPVTFQGYVDWFNHYYHDQPTVVQAEPQLLVRSHQWAIGTELEISRNFRGAYTKKQGFSYETWDTHPTIFLRVDF